jgi:dTDP-4-dehydrorhamnose 3,5-epimerase
MEFRETTLPGVVEIHIEPRSDERGFFARTWCEKEFESNRMNPRVAQCSVSYNESKGTMRGMHYQVDPFGEAKVVRCTAGSIYDVAIDLRPQSPRFRQWVGVVLSAKERNMLYIPEGFAHGFLTLEDKTEVFYQISEFYHPEASRGVRWDDPAFAIQWPEAVRVISERDRTFPDFSAPCLR